MGRPPFFLGAVFTGAGFFCMGFTGAGPLTFLAGLTAGLGLGAGAFAGVVVGFVGIRVGIISAMLNHFGNLILLKHYS